MKKVLALSFVFLAACGGKSEVISPGWYRRADSNAQGNMITSFNMNVGETDVRCLCGDGFKGVYNADIFKVTEAPKGYDDTIGRKFFKGADGCPSLNCSD